MLNIKLNIIFIFFPAKLCTKYSFMNNFVFMNIFLTVRFLTPQLRHRICIIMHAHLALRCQISKSFIHFYRHCVNLSLKEKGKANFYPLKENMQLYTKVDNDLKSKNRNLKINKQTETYRLYFLIRQVSIFVLIIDSDWQ